jgi:hypothetical protein
MTATTDLSRMSKEELLACVAECARVRRQAEALCRRLELELARSNYERRRRGLPVLYGWAGLADQAVAARLWCHERPRLRGPL